MADLTPDYVAAAVVDVGPEEIRALSPGTRAICLDIDGTITDYHAPAVDEAARARLASYRDAGYITVVVSNCYGERAHEVHRLFGGLVTAVITPVDCVDPSVPGDKASRHRKPAPDMLIAAASRNLVPDPAGARPLRPDELLMVGDQLYKDVAAARAAGARSLLVPRVGRGDHPAVRLLQRPVEAMVRRSRGLPVRRRDWPTRLTAVDSGPGGH